MEVWKFGSYAGSSQRGRETPVHYHTGQVFARRVLQGKDIGGVWCFVAGGLDCQIYLTDGVVCGIKSPVKGDIMVVMTCKFRYKPQRGDIMVETIKCNHVVRSHFGGIFVVEQTKIVTK